MRRLRKPTNLLLVLVFFLPFIFGGFTLANQHARDMRDTQRNRAEIAQLKSLQEQELATFTLLKNTIDASKAQTAKLTAEFIDALLARIQKEDAALLHAINTHSEVITLPGRTVTRTRTVCRTPSGRSC